jgi:PadR family transcriptional regulator PadR
MNVVSELLSSLEMVLLGSILELGPDDAYGLAIWNRAKGIAGAMNIAYGSLYPTLDRLEQKGFVSSVTVAQRSGGRPRRYFRVEASGESAYHATGRMLRSLPGMNPTEGLAF